MSESEFDRIAEFFRDPRFWMINDAKEWVKRNNYNNSR